MVFRIRSIYASMVFGILIRFFGVQVPPPHRYFSVLVLIPFTSGLGQVVKIINGLSLFAKIDLNPAG